MKCSQPQSSVEYAKSVFVLRMPEDKHFYTVGVLDSKYNFSSFELSVKDDICAASMKTLRNAFKRLALCSATDIVLSDTIGRKSALYQYISIIRQYVKFKLRTIRLENAFLRIAKFHTSFIKNKDAVRLSDYAKIYRKMLHSDICMWITPETDVAIQNLSAKRCRLQKILRVCMYYICIKQYYMSKNKKSASKT